MAEPTTQTSTATKQTPSNPPGPPAAQDQAKAPDQATLQGAGSDAAVPGGKTPTEAADAAADAQSGNTAAVSPSPVDPNAGGSDQAAEELTREQDRGYHGFRPDPTPHDHYSVSGVTSGMATPENNAVAALMTGNSGRFRHLSEDELQDHSDAPGVEEIAERAKERNFVI